MEGYLLKKSSHKSVFKFNDSCWKKVFVVLEESKRLTSYANETKLRRLKSYELQSNMVILNDNDDHNNRNIFSLCLRETSTPFVTFSADTPVKKNRWSESIKSCIAAFAIDFQSRPNESLSDIKILFRNKKTVQVLTEAKTNWKSAEYSECNLHYIYGRLCWTLIFKDSIKTDEELAELALTNAIKMENGIEINSSFSYKRNGLNFFCENSSTNEKNTFVFTDNTDLNNFILSIENDNPSLSPFKDYNINFAVGMNKIFRNLIITNNFLRKWYFETSALDTNSHRYNTKNMFVQDLVDAFVAVVGPLSLITEDDAVPFEEFFNVLNANPPLFILLTQCLDLSVFDEPSLLQLFTKSFKNESNEFSNNNNKFIKSSSADKTFNHHSNNNNSFSENLKIFLAFLSEHVSENLKLDSKNDFRGVFTALIISLYGYPTNSREVFLNSEDKDAWQRQLKATSYSKIVIHNWVDFRFFITNSAFSAYKLIVHFIKSVDFNATNNSCNSNAFSFKCYNDNENLNAGNNNSKNNKNDISIVNSIKECTTKEFLVSMISLRNNDSSLICFLLLHETTTNEHFEKLIDVYQEKLVFNNRTLELFYNEKNLSINIALVTAKELLFDKDGTINRKLSNYPQIATIVLNALLRILKNDLNQQISNKHKIKELFLCLCRFECNDSALTINKFLRVMEKKLGDISKIKQEILDILMNIQFYRFLADITSKYVADYGGTGLIVSLDEVNEPLPTANAFSIIPSSKKNVPVVDKNIFTSLSSFSDSVNAFGFDANDSIHFNFDNVYEVLDEKYVDNTNFFRTLYNNNNSTTTSIDEIVVDNTTHESFTSSSKETSDYANDSKKSIQSIDSYNHKEISDGIFGFFIIYYECNSESIITVPTSKLATNVNYKSVLVSFLKSLQTKFYSLFFGKGETLRRRFVEYLVQRFSIFKEFKFPLLNDVFFFSRFEHFDESIIKALVIRVENVSIELGYALITAALKLEDFDGLASKLREIYDEIGVYVDRKDQLNVIINAVHARNLKELGSSCGVTLLDLVTCAQYAAVALRVLNRMPTNKESEKLKRMFSLYLNTSKPDSWKNLFKSAETIAVFIKYMDRENLDKAYDCFLDINKNPEILAMIKTVKKKYPQPFLRPDDISFVSENSMDEFLRNFVETKSNKTVDMQLLSRIYGEWMINRKKIVGIPMAPRNTQMILTMLIIEWLKNKTIRKTLIAQVGTGEGKSLIIAMLCVYFVIGLKKKVHVLENNVGLLKRDYASFVEFFTKFGISVGDCESSSKNFYDKDICYCLRSSMEQYYRLQIFSGENPFKNTFLIVDEVDELIVDKKPNNQYVKLDSELTDLLKQCFDALRDKKTLPEEVRNSVTYKEAAVAYKEAGTKIEGKHYKLHGDMYYLLSSRGEIRKHTYALWLEYINYKNKQSYSPRILTCFFYQSMPYMMLQYDAIVGLTGAKGSPAEQKFLDETYITSNVTVPPFLSTCNGVEKELPKLIDNTVYLYENASTQNVKIIALANQLALKVPVLIITGKPDEALKISKLFNYKNETENRVQTFLQYGEEETVKTCDTIVKQSTEKLKNSIGYRITITDYWGGRGHDYTINDEEVKILNELLSVIAFFKKK
jgi:hypothetical protein